MSKYINEDAEKLTKYFKEFELKNIFLNSEFVDEFKKVHKKTLGYLVIYFEIEKQNKRSKFFQEKAIYYLKESVSDILQSFFVGLMEHIKHQIYCYEVQLKILTKQ